MERVFTKDIGKNFKAGEVKDFPVQTWKQIEKSAKQRIDDFSSLTRDVIKSAGFKGKVKT